MRKFVVVGLLALVGVSLLALAGSAASNRYSDDDGSVHEPALEVLGSMGILDRTECGTGKICPNDPIDRWTVAVWLVRAVDEQDPDAVTTSRFVDVDVNDWRVSFVEKLAEHGITSGCSVTPARFCPDNHVIRAHMATFLTRAFDLQAASPAGFTDIAGNAHAANIDALAAAGVTQGCGTDPLRFCPSSSVTRGQMATFLARAMGLALPPRSPGDSVDCDDFDTQGEAQAFFNIYYPHYGDVAKLDDGTVRLSVCEELPSTWIYRETVDEFTDAVSPWIEVVGSKDDASDWEDPPYLGLSCGADFINLRTRFFGKRIDVEFRFVPSDTVFESWHTSNEGSDTFLLPPADTQFTDQLLAGDSEELRLRVNERIYRLPVNDVEPSVGWLILRCAETSSS